MPNKNIGILLGLEIKGGNREKKVVDKLSSSFLITFSRIDFFKSTEYTFAFLKPQEKFRDMFNLYNEVLLLFHPYPTFDSRCLDFVDKTLSIDYPNRLDKICLVIISADNSIEKRIELQNKQNKESKIIVPFTYDEILDDAFLSDHLENKFCRYFYSRDLFALESPLKSENYFYGRSHIVQKLYDKYCLGEHSGLFGLRKIGKTSVLFGLERMISLREGCSLYIDCQDTAIHKSTWNILLHKIIAGIKEKYELKVKTIDLNYYSEDKASESFEKDLKAIKSALPKNPRILLIFDEIEHISFNTSTSEQWREGTHYINFWQTIRAIYQRNSDLFTFVIAGVNPQCIEKAKVNAFDNPIFSIITPVYLELFDYNNVKEMVSSIGKYMGLMFDPEIFAHLTDDYGGHPFLIRHVCSLINKDINIYRPQTVTKYMYKEQKNRYDKLIQTYVELIIDILQTWYPEEYELLELLVDNGSDKFTEKIAFNGNIIQHLIGYGIVKYSEGKYYITINAVEKYIEFAIKKSKRPDTKTAKWSYISEHRNQLEEKIREIILTVMKIHYGKKTKEQLLILIDEPRKSKLSNLSIEDIFNQHLYFSDYKKIVSKYWTFFQNVFIDKLKFESYMEYINKYRIDAHAKDISDEDLGVLMISMKWLEDVLGDIA